MHGLGTLINALAIIAGGLLGIGCKRFLKEHYQETIMKATGFAVVFLGGQPEHCRRCWCLRKLEQVLRPRDP